MNEQKRRITCYRFVEKLDRLNNPLSASGIKATVIDEFFGF